MPSEFSYEYPTRIHRIVIPTSSNSSLFDIGSLTKIPSRYQAFRIPPPSDSLIREIRSERKFPIPPKPRIVPRLIKRETESDFDSEFILKPWPLMDIPAENAEDVDCDDDDDDDLSEEPIIHHDLPSKSIPQTLGDFLLDIPPRIPNLPLPTDLLELTSTQPDQLDQPDSSISKVWVNPQYEAILKRKAEDENDALDSKKRKTS